MSTLLENQTRDILSTISLREEIGSHRETEWRPQVFDLSIQAHRDALDKLISSDSRIAIHDTLSDQVRGLLDVRDPATKLSDVDRDRAVDELTGGIALELYGRWVFYPWSYRLVHVLPEREYCELRTSTNRNKISAEEQARLSSGSFGIVGLSSGAAIAVTLVLEGVGGRFILADFDRLELSNMNRLNVSVYELGHNKAHVAARRMFEINPFCQIEVIPDGLTSENVDLILTGSRFGKLDAVFEQCDDLYAKFLLRERARISRVCVLMQTSDRGLMNVERFDLEPERPLFHGLTGNMRATELRDMTTYEKIPTVLKIVDVSAVSERMAASLIDVDTTLKSWPQLASEIALGAAVGTDVARRILLKQMTRSGRFRLDVAQAVCDVSDPESAPTPPSSVDDAVETSEPHSLPPLVPVRSGLSDNDVRALVAYAAAAPSGGNCQPWRFSYTGGVLRISIDRKRAENFLDYRNHASYLALGAATENASLAAAAMGMPFALRMTPDANPADVVCELDLVGSNRQPPVYDPLVRGE